MLLSPGSPFLFSAVVKVMKRKVVPIVVACLLFVSHAASQGAAESFFDRGVKLTATKEFKGAAELFKQAIQKDPTNSVAYRYLAWCQSELGQHELAVESARKAISLDPGDYVAYNNLGWALTSLGRTDEAIGELKTSIKMNPSYSLSRSNLG